MACEVGWVEYRGGGGGVVGGDVGWVRLGGVGELGLGGAGEWWVCPLK